MPCLPAIDFPIYGLSRKFLGRRTLGLWDRIQTGHEVDDETAPVWRVTLIHTIEPGHDDLRLPPLAMIKVSTIAKLPDNGGLALAPVEEAASAALFGVAEMGSFRRFGKERFTYLRQCQAEASRLQSDLTSRLWDEVTVCLNGQQSLALYHCVEDIWAFVIDADDRGALGVSGYGIEVSDCEFVQVDDVEAYQVIF